LLLEPDRPLGGIRRYGHADVTRVKFVKSAQRLGFTLEEVAQLLKLEDGAHCSEAAKLATLRLTDVRIRLADLTRMETALSTLVDQCCSRHGSISCPLIASLHAC
jgi:MerR family mercuric resistance operon transcriptional regulator